MITSSYIIILILILFCLLLRIVATYKAFFNTVAKLAILAVAVAAGDGYHLGLDN